MSKLYALTRNGIPQRRGNCGKFTWTSPARINYHIKPTKWNQDRTNGLDVSIIDLQAGTVVTIPAKAFVAQTQNPETIKAEIKKQFGISIGLIELSELVKSGKLNAVAEVEIVEFLRLRGISF